MLLVVENIVERVEQFVGRGRLGGELRVEQGFVAVLESEGQRLLQRPDPVGVDLRARRARGFRADRYDEGVE